MFGDEGVVPPGVFGPLLWFLGVSLWSSDGVLSPLVSCLPSLSPSASSCEGVSCRVPSAAILQYLSTVEVNVTQLLPGVGGKGHTKLNRSSS